MIKLTNRREAPFGLEESKGIDVYAGFIRVYVGKEKRVFILPRKQLGSLSPYFCARMDRKSIWLRDTCPDMFELFAYWVNERTHFGAFIDDAEDNDECERLHDDLINVHLFAAQTGICQLQDAAMDAIQDMYLQCDWDIRPRLVNYVYTACDSAHSCRLRKWIVAMTAWTLGGRCPEENTMAGKMEQLFESCPAFKQDYSAHMHKTLTNKVPIHFKSPSLRLPSNSFKTDERHFGFRQCSFHTHRSRVGQGPCPHDTLGLYEQTRNIMDKPLPTTPTTPTEHHITSPSTSIYNMYLNTPGSSQQSLVHMV